jgi:hypothetical protein
MKKHERQELLDEIKRLRALVSTLCERCEVKATLFECLIKEDGGVSMIVCSPSLDEHETAKWIAEYMGFGGKEPEMIGSARVEE